MFCKNCGNELNENAYVCPKCGALVGGKKQKGKKEINAESDKVLSLLNKIFGFVGLGVGALALLFMFMAIGKMDFYTYDVGYYFHTTTGRCNTLIPFVLSILSTVFNTAHIIISAISKKFNNEFWYHVIFTVFIIGLIIITVSMKNFGW